MQEGFMLLVSIRTMNETKGKTLEEIEIMWRKNKNHYIAYSSKRSA